MSTIDPTTGATIYTPSELYQQAYNPFGVKSQAMSQYVTNVPGLDGLMPNVASDPTGSPGIVTGDLTGQVSLVGGDSSTPGALLKSSNFVSGSSGWQIDSAGNAEFNSGVFRGALSAASIDIPAAGAAGWHVDNTGNMWWGNSANFAGATIKIAATGAVAFTSGTIGGWSMSSTQITSTGTNPIVIDSSNASISSGQIAWNNGTGFWLAGGVTPVFSVGNSGGNSMTWNGSVLSISGSISASSITIGTNAWHVDTSGNMWWGSSGTYAGATIKISSAGDVNFTTGTFSGTVNASAGTFTGDVSTTAGIKASSGSSLAQLNGTNGALESYLSGNIRMKMDSNGLTFYDTSGNARGNLRGATATRATGVLADSDITIPNNKSFWVTSSGGGGSEYGGMSITNADEFWLTLGTANKFFVKNNAQNDNYFTASNTQIFSGRRHQFASFTDATGFSAASFKGMLYFDNTQTDLVFSNGTQWYKITATAIPISSAYPG